MPVDNNVDFFFLLTFCFYNFFHLGGVEEHISIETNEVYGIICITCYTSFDPNIDFHK